MCLCVAHQVALELFGPPHPDPAHLFKRAMAPLELWLTEARVQTHTASSATAETLSAAMTMLRSAAVRAADLADLSHPTAELEGRCQVFGIEICSAAHVPYGIVRIVGQSK